MKRIFAAILVIVIYNLKAAAADPIKSFTTDGLRISIDSKGNLTEITSLASNKNYLYADTSSALLTLVSNGKRILPSSAKWIEKSKSIVLSYNSDNAVEITVKVSLKKSHMVLEIIKAEPASAIEAIVWGPFPTTITKMVGEIIGVVRDEKAAVGLQVLNVKTLGGAYATTEGLSFSRGEAAKAYRWGSSFQAFSINRDRPRHVDAWGGEFKNLPPKPMKGETVTGSKIALFGCREEQTLDYIEKIELAENLPHPTINGVWAKRSNIPGRSYLISSFREKEVDEMIDYTKRAGLISLYHEGPYKTWGHYDWDTSFFPDGKESVKRSAQKAKAAGLFFGTHTLTNFITTNDRYVTPVPDDRLALTGYSTLKAGIDAKAGEIEVGSPEYFNNKNANWLHTVKIGKELIRYQSVTDQSPYKLIGCERGAFGTTASAHAANDTVGKLLDHAYRVFFPNIELQKEIAVNLAKLFNETGVNHLDFDGLEGCAAAGQGDYGIESFPKDFYDNIHHEFINGPSNSETFYWHINTYCNWGEPWYGGFRESMQQYRIDNQELFDRNLMPHMLGWYLLTKTTTMVEMEWMLARAAGYNAGFAMVARPDEIRKNPISGQLLDAIREWETARTSHAFSADQQERLKKTSFDFHLEKTSEGAWNLFQYNKSALYSHLKELKQPGEPTYASWEYDNPVEGQPLQFIIESKGKSGNIHDLQLTIDNAIEIQLPITLNAGETVICDGTTLVRIYNEKGRERASYDLKKSLPQLSKGVHKILFDCRFEGDETPQANLQFKSLVSTEKLVSKK